MVIKNNSLQLNKVIYIGQTFGLGGAESFMSDLLVALQKSSHIAVEAATTYSRFEDELRRRTLHTRHIPVAIDMIGDWKGFVKAIFYLPYAIWWYGRYLSKLKKQSAPGQKIIILLSGFSEKFLISWWAKSLHLPVVWIEFGPLDTVIHKFWSVPRLLYMSALHIPEIIIVPSENTRRHLHQSLGIANAKMHFIQCGRDMRVPKNSSKRILAPGKRHLVCVSRLEPGKGQDLLIKAMPEILKKIPSVHLTIVGEGDFLPTLYQVARELQLEAHITFAGRVASALEYMRQAEVCVFPSVWPLEGFGLVAVEAMALGKPIVAFANGPTPEIIQHKKNGLLAARANISELAEMCITMLKEPGLARRLSIQAKKDYHLRYEITPVAQKYLEQFDRIFGTFYEKKK